MTGTRQHRVRRVQRDLRLNIVTVPTNKPCARQDMPDSVYKTVNGKYNAVIEQCWNATPRASRSWWHREH